MAREVVTGYNSKELFNIETRHKVQTQIEENMKKALNAKNIALDATLLRNVQFSDIYLHAIEEKQVAEQKIQKAEFEKQEASIRKEKKIIEAEADAEAIKLK
jgi:prohibitin 1